MGDAGLAGCGRGSDGAPCTGDNIVIFRQVCIVSCIGQPLLDDIVGAGNSQAGGINIGPLADGDIHIGIDKVAGRGAAHADRPGCTAVDLDVEAGSKVRRQGHAVDIDSRAAAAV